MALRKWEFTDSGGLIFWTEDMDGNVQEEVVLNPTTNGQGEISFTTSDGVTKVGEVKPGAASDTALGK